MQYLVIRELKKNHVKNSNNKNIRKENLPTKICLHCSRPFSWRKKWERSWDEVKYCSDACKSKKFLPKN
jgi:hypothetical protein